MNNDYEFGFGGILYVFVLIMIVVASVFYAIFGGFTFPSSDAVNATKRMENLINCKNIILEIAKEYDYEVTSKDELIHGNEGAYFKYELNKEDSHFFIHVINNNEINGELYVTINHCVYTNEESFDVGCFIKMIQKTCQANFKQETCESFIQADEATYPDLERNFDVLKDKNIYKKMYINDAQYNAISQMVYYDYHPIEYNLMFEGWSYSDL